MQKSWWLILICIPILLACSGPKEPDPQQMIVEKARKALAEYIGLPDPASIEVKGIQPETWDDTCLGVLTASDYCGVGNTSGYRVFLTAIGQNYEYRVSQDGLLVLRTPLFQGDRTIILLGHEEDEEAGWCQELEVYSDGSYVIESCLQANKILVQSFLPDTLMQQLLTWVQEYEFFDYSTPLTGSSQESWGLFFGRGTGRVPEEVRVKIIWHSERLITNHAQTSADVPEELTPTPEAASSWTGIVFANDNGLWTIKPSGDPLLLVDRIDAILSPDLRDAVFMEKGDLWLVNLTTNAVINLTNTPDRLETIQSWETLDQGNSLVFTSFARGDSFPLGTTGYLSTVDLDGSNYRVLDTKHPVTTLSASPDGKVAWSSSGQGYLYDLLSGTTPFIPQEYGAEGITELFAPAWSPQGDQIAWLVGTGNAENRTYKVGLFNVVQGTCSLLLEHKVPDFAPQPFPGKWSPDGLWYAVFLLRMNADYTGVWIAPADPTQKEAYLGKTTNPIWKGNEVLVVQSTVLPGLSQFLIENRILEALEFPFPADYIVNWMPP